MTEATPTAPRGAIAPRRWWRLALREGGGLLAVAVALVAITFLIVRLIPGDPARRIVGLSGGADRLAVAREQLGLDGSWVTQLGDYTSGLLQGDLGQSFTTQESVGAIIADALPYTLALATLAAVVVFVTGISVGLGVAVATREGRRPWLDSSFQAVTSIGGSFPEYVAGTLLVLLVGIWLGLLPVAGADSPSSILLPLAAVSLAPSCTLARIVRRETATVLEQDYMRTARSKRLPWRRVYLRHALPNLMTATLGYAGLLFAALLGGTVVVENVFAWPGVGTRVIEAVTARDYPVIQGSVLVLGLIAASTTIGVDLLLQILDPRRRRGSAR